MKRQLGKEKKKPLQTYTDTVTLIIIMTANLSDDQDSQTLSKANAHAKTLLKSTKFTAARQIGTHLFRIMLVRQFVPQFGFQ